MGLLDSLFGGGNSRSDQYINPGQNPYLNDIYGSAQSLYNQLGPFQGNPLNFAAQDQMMDTMGGAYMPGSDTFQNQMQAMYNQMRPGLDSQFASAGRRGSGLHQIGAEQRMSDAGMGIMNQERNRMMQASQFAPQLSSAMAQAPWQNLQNYANIIGPPTVMGSSESSQNNGIFSPIALF